jgi:hypothetical protein
MRASISIGFAALRSACEQRHGERHQRVNPTRAFSLVELASAGRIPGNNRVSAAPLQDRVRPVAQLPLDNQALDDVDGRRHIFEALSVRLERDVAADSIKLTLQIVDPSAVEGERRDVVLPVDLGDLARNGARVGRRPDRTVLG